MPKKNLMEQKQLDTCFSCPQCDSKAFKRNGYTRHGKQNHRCLDCGRQFSLEPSADLMSNFGIESELADEVEAIAQ